MKKSTRYSPEVRERAVRMVMEHQAGHDSQWTAIVGSPARKRAKVQQSPSQAASQFELLLFQRSLEPSLNVPVSVASRPFRRRFVETKG